MKSAKQYKIDTYLRIANASTDDFTREDAIKKALDLLENRVSLEVLESEVLTQLDLFLDENYVISRDAKDKVSKYDLENDFVTWCVSNRFPVPDKKAIQGLMLTFGVVLRKQSNNYYIGLAKPIEKAEEIKTEEAKINGR